MSVSALFFHKFYYITFYIWKGNSINMHPFHLWCLHGRMSMIYSCKHLVLTYLQLLMTSMLVLCFPNDFFCFCLKDSFNFIAYNRLLFWYFLIRYWWDYYVCFLWTMNDMSWYSFFEVKLEKEGNLERAGKDYNLFFCSMNALERPKYKARNWVKPEQISSML